MIFFSSSPETLSSFKTPGVKTNMQQDFNLCLESDMSFCTPKPFTIKAKECAGQTPPPHPRAPHLDTPGLPLLLPLDPPHLPAPAVLLPPPHPMYGLKKQSF